MRISTVTQFEQSVTAMNRQQGDLMRVGQQIASGRRVVNPSDDPQASARALQVSQSQAVTQQFTDARVSARNALAQEESILNSVSDAVISAKTLMIQAANGTLADVDRASIASELRGIYETAIGQANATDGNGRYLFGGFQDAREPFDRGAGGAVTYIGDDNIREQRIDASRLMPVADNGATVFQSVPDGAGYVAEAAAGNTGSVTFAGPQAVATDHADYGQPFTVTFADNAGTMTFSVSSGGAPVPGVQNVTYQSGAPIEFGGLSIELSGAAEDGDEIRMDLAANRDPNLFATFEKALAVLETPALTAAQGAALDNTLSTVMREFDHSLDNVLTTRASVGARLNELDVVDRVAENRHLNYEQTLSELVDLNYVEAISEYSLRQVGLQAAQKTFVDTRSLSLFNYLK